MYKMLHWNEILKSLKRYNQDFGHNIFYELSYVESCFRHIEKCGCTIEIVVSDYYLDEPIHAYEIELTLPAEDKHIPLIFLMEKMPGFTSCYYKKNKLYVSWHG